MADPHRRSSIGNWRRTRPLGLRAGGTGGAPVPSGDSPDGTGTTLRVNAWVLFQGKGTPIPRSGESWPPPHVGGYEHGGARASRPQFSASGRKPLVVPAAHHPVNPLFWKIPAGETPAGATGTVALPLLSYPCASGSIRGQFILRFPAGTRLRHAVTLPRQPQTLLCNALTSLRQGKTLLRQPLTSLCNAVTLLRQSQTLLCNGVTSLRQGVTWQCFAVTSLCSARMSL